MTALHLIRHGRASATAEDYDALRPDGETQSRLLGEHLARRGQRFDRVYVGPLKRQRDTLSLMREAAGELGAGWPDAVMLEGLEEAPYESLMKQHMLPRVAEDAVLRERLEVLSVAADGAARHAALNHLFDHMAGLWHAGEVAPELQSYAEFRDAVLQAYGRIRVESADAAHVAVVTSNGVIGCILQHAVGAKPPDGERMLKLANTSVSVLELAGDGVVLRAQDDIAHIDDPVLITIL